MKRATMNALVVDRGSTAVTLCSPTTGRVRLDRGQGEILTGGSRLGVLFRDERAIDLIVPAGVVGRIESIHRHQGVIDADHGYALLSLSTQALDEIGGLAEKAGGSSKSAVGAEDTPTFELLSSTHGTFYHRASPESDPYVIPGQAVAAGQTVGLIEVMKCFSPVHFEPPPGNTRGIVRRILPGDGDEVQSGDVLLIVDLREEA